MLEENVTIQDICDWVADCEESELTEHQPDDNPERRDTNYMAMLKVEVEGEDGGEETYYLKIRLRLPNLDDAYLLSFHRWGE